MHQKVSPRIVSLTFGILVICFVVAFYVVAWQEPSQAPPEGNVPTPLNVGSVHQTKEGDLSIGEADIKGDGSISTNLNADKLDDYHAADLLATVEEVYTECKAKCVSSNTISCDSGWTKVAWVGGTGCQSQSFGIRPQWGGEWAFSHYQYGWGESQYNSQQVLYNSEVKCGVICGYCESFRGCTWYDSATAICCR